MGYFAHLVAAGLLLVSVAQAKLAIPTASSRTDVRHLRRMAKVPMPTVPSVMPEALRLRGGATSPGEASIGLKTALQAGLTILNVGSWLVPLNMPSFVDSPGAMSIANTLSKAIFIALAFCSLLPHAIHEFGALAQPMFAPPEAIACTMACVGYMLVFVVEKVAFETDTLLDGVRRIFIQSQTFQFCLWSSKIF